jgi:hypothetical protein
MVNWTGVIAKCVNWITSYVAITARYAKKVCALKMSDDPVRGLCDIEIYGDSGVSFGNRYAKRSGFG